MRKRWAPRTHSPIHAMGCCHHPVSLDEGPSAGVMPVATGVVLEGDLGRGGRMRNTAGVSPYGPGGLRLPWDLPADPGKDPPGRARRARVPRSHRLPVAPHRDPARSRVLWERGLGWRGKRIITGGSSSANEADDFPQKTHRRGRGRRGGRAAASSWTTAAVRLWWGLHRRRL